MTPEEYLGHLEGTAAYAEVITNIRDALIEKGWTVPGAEQAAITVVATLGHSR